MASTSTGLVHHDADSKTPADPHNAMSAPYKRRSPSTNGSTSRMAKTWLVTIHQFIDQPVRPQNLAAISSPGATCCSSWLNTARYGSAVLATSYPIMACPLRALARKAYRYGTVAVLFLASEGTVLGRPGPAGSPDVCLPGSLSICGRVSWFQLTPVERLAVFALAAGLFVSLAALVWRTAAASWLGATPGRGCSRSRSSGSAGWRVGHSPP